MNVNKNGSKPSPSIVSTKKTLSPDPEVTPDVIQKAKRRQFSARFKLRVVEETDRLSEGEVCAYLRRHGLYWSYLSKWRQQRESGALANLEPKKRGRGKAAPHPLEREVLVMRRELDDVQEQLRQANLILEVQKKVLSLCGARTSGKSRTS
jgi:transposase